MPRRKTIPQYGLHKPSGQARVIVDGKHLYLGPYGSEESRQAYARILSRHLQDDASQPPHDSGAIPALLIAELLVKYLQHAERYYSVNGVVSGELRNIKHAIVPLRLLFALTMVNRFGPKALARVQQHMVKVQGLCRKQVNARINRIRRIFRWAVGEELAPSGLYEALRCVPSLRYGRCDATEHPPVRPVADEVIEATLAFLSPPVRAMVQVQRLTGARPSSICLMRSCDIERSGPVWFYRPQTHKTRYLDRELVIAIGPRAQEILRPFLDRQPNAYLFSPKESLSWHHEQQRANRKERKTPVYPCERRRLQEKRRRARSKPKMQQVADCFNRVSYHQAIHQAIRRGRQAGAQIPSWFPSQLRHARGTEVREKFGLDAAQATLGQARVEVTQIYAMRNSRLATEVALQTG